MYFRNFVIIYPWKKGEPFIWLNLNLLHPKMICEKFGWNWPSGSGEEDFLNLSMFFRNFIIISSWKRRGRSFEQTQTPSIQKCVPSLVETAPVFLDRKIFKICWCIFGISKLFPLKKMRGPSFEQTWISFAQGCSVPSLVEIGSVVLKKKMKMSKVYDNNDDNDNDDDDEPWTKLDQKSSLEPWAQVR